MKKNDYEIKFFGNKFYITLNKPIIPVHKKNDYHLATDNILRNKDRNIALFPTQKAAEDFMKTYKVPNDLDLKKLAMAIKKTR